MAIKLLVMEGMKRLGPLSLVILVFVATLLLASPAFANPLTLVGPGFQESGYSLVYALAIPTAEDLGSSVQTYNVNNAASIPNGSFTRIGYYLELETASDVITWVSVSMDAFTNNASLIGVPSLASGEIFDQSVTNLDVFTNVAGVTTGTGLTGGFVQLWPNCYSNQSNNGYKTGQDIDNLGTNCYGSMQIGDGSGNTVFAYNDFSGAGSSDDIGIGNAASGNPDWTFWDNTGTYTVKNLEIFVGNETPAVPEPATLGLVGSALVGLYVKRRKR